jgi:nucleotide-binding universal stress UspA family protein
MRTIVVGVDGSVHAAAALRWADREAQRHGASLVALLTWTLLEQHHAGGAKRFDPAYGDEAATAALAEVVAEVEPRTQVELRVACDLPARALVEASEGADLVVVGARGLGGFKGLLLGSVSERVLEHSRCPVAVVRTEADAVEDGPVVVGVDGSPEATTALRWAAAEARCRGSRLCVVHAWETPAAALPTSAAVIDSIEEGAERIARDAGADEALGGLDVSTTVFHGSATAGLLDLAHGASMVVVGAAGHGTFERALLGLDEPAGRPTRTGAGGRRPRPDVSVVRPWTCRTPSSSAMRSSSGSPASSPSTRSN